MDTTDYIEDLIRKYSLKLGEYEQILRRAGRFDNYVAGIMGKSVLLKEQIKELKEDLSKILKNK